MPCFSSSSSKTLFFTKISQFKFSFKLEMKWRIITKLLVKVRCEIWSMDTSWNCKLKKPTWYRQQCQVSFLTNWFVKKRNWFDFCNLVDKLRSNCQVFLSFGNEAFLSSIEWTLICAAHFSNYQKTVCEEIMRVIGTQRIPEFKDELRMPFTSAFINEVFRWKSVLPFSFVRR